MSGGVIQGTFLAGGPKLATPAAPPPAHVVQARMAQPVAQPSAMPRPPGPPAPAHVAQARIAQAQGGAMPRQPGPPPPAHVAQPQTAGGAIAVDPALLRAAGRAGQPLPDAVQRKMEQAFGADFSSVRVHEGPQAESIGAIAFTVGTDIYFAPGRFQPHTAAGQQLLGHELTHVLQQRAGRVRNPLGSGLAVVQDHALEAEADRMGHRAAAQMMPAAPAQKTVQPAAQAKGGGHKLVVGTYLHRGPGATGLPAEAAGHTFVAIEAPGGRREAYGFSPADPQRYDFQRDIGQLRAGVPGAVQREDGALAKPGVRTRSYDVSPEQAQAALAKVAEYKTHAPAFSFAQRDCGRFATEVLKAASINDFVGPRVRRPAELYRQVQGPVSGGVQAKTPGPPPRGQRPLALHVQAAVTAGPQSKLPIIQLGGRPLAPHVRAATASCAQPIMPAAPLMQAAIVASTQSGKRALGQRNGQWGRAVQTASLYPSKTRDQVAGEKAPFVDLPSGRTRADFEIKGGLLGTKLQDARAKEKAQTERGKPPVTTAREAEYLFHSTTWRNLQSILVDGLDPRFGGSSAGASVLATNQRLVQDSIRGSTGYIHGATNSGVACDYAKKFDSKEKRKHVREITGFAVILRFRTSGREWQSDTEDSRGNYKTRSRVLPHEIEYLDILDGWHPITHIKNKEIFIMLQSQNQDEDLFEYYQARAGEDAIGSDD